MRFTTLIQTQATEEGSRPGEAAAAAARGALTAKYQSVCSYRVLPRIVPLREHFHSYTLHFFFRFPRKIPTAKLKLHF